MAWGKRLISVLLILVLVAQGAIAGFYANSEDDLYLKYDYNGYKIPYKARFIRSDYGGIEKPYHAYYADPEAGYMRTYDYDEKPVRSTREYSYHKVVANEPLEMVRSQNSNIRSEYYYYSKYDNSYLMEVANSMRYEKEESTYFDCDETFRNRPSMPTGYKYVSSVQIDDIPDISDSTKRKKPSKIYNKPDDYYYNPRERTTLELPYIYYKIERKRYEPNQES